MMRLAEMMNNLRTRVVNYIHIHTLRHTGILSHRFDIDASTGREDRG